MRESTHGRCDQINVEHRSDMWRFAGEIWDCRKGLRDGERQRVRDLEKRVDRSGVKLVTENKYIGYM